MIVSEMGFVYLLSQHRQFGASSEKTNPDQLELSLFNDAEVTDDRSIEEPTVQTITYRRKKSAWPTGNHA